MTGPTGYLEVGPRRFREDAGLSFDDYVVGDVYEHRPGRTVLDADNVWGSLLSHNQHPLHIDAVYAAGTEFGRLVVSSLVTFSIVNGMTVRTVSQRAIANLGWDAVRLRAPVFVGDTLTAESTVLGVRPSASRPGQGIVIVHTIGRNQDDVVVIEFDRTLLAGARDASAPPRTTTSGQETT